MNWKAFIGAFLTIFLAELGDKTQLAVITMSANTESKWSVFLGACLALIAVTFIAILVGDLISRYIPTEWLHRIVAIAFILIGVLMLAGKL
ncbi:MAG: TMEM165/GDT1 family protein [Pyrinomonadaceae bacterium]|nr:TMEM165/GDT1 family protein [Pyrinomonadaceae bacterium]MCX7640140.1 TMEM165/GDT1 family protein [Pyrinomonadaceae bacterium]MDW8303272.1 TMEM165/GDT1 family protein [Acidobacteriota bacterium]